MARQQRLPTHQMTTTRDRHQQPPGQEEIEAEFNAILNEQKGREVVPAMGAFKTCPLRTAALKTLLGRHGLLEANSTWKAETRLRAGLKAPVLDWKYGGKSSLNSVPRLAGAIAAQLRDRSINRPPPRPPLASAAPSLLKGRANSCDGPGQSASSRVLRSRDMLLKTDDDTGSTGGPVNKTQEPTAPAAAADVAPAAAQSQKRPRQRAKKSALGFGSAAFLSPKAADEALPRRCNQQQPAKRLPDHNDAGGVCGNDPGVGRAMLSARKRATPSPALLTKSLKSIRRPDDHQLQTTTADDDDDDAKAAPPRSSNAADGTARPCIGLSISRSSPASAFSIINGGGLHSGSATGALVGDGDGLPPSDKVEQPAPEDGDDEHGDDGEGAHGETAHLAALLMAAAETINSQEHEIERLCSLLEKQEKTLRLVDAELLNRICRRQV